MSITTILVVTLTQILALFLWWALAIVKNSPRHTLGASAVLLAQMGWIALSTSIERVERSAVVLFILIVALLQSYIMTKVDKRRGRETESAPF
jgi:uncharacterized membrane protein YfcA